MFDINGLLPLMAGQSGMPGTLGGHGNLVAPGQIQNIAPGWTEQQITAAEREKAPGGFMSGLMSDPNFHSFLAGVGARLDPEGPGGAIGLSAREVIQNKAMGAAMEKQDARWKALIEAVKEGKVKKGTLKEDKKLGTATMTVVGREDDYTGWEEGGGHPLGSLDEPQTPQKDPASYMDQINALTEKYFGRR